MADIGYALAIALAAALYLVLGAVIAGMAARRTVLIDDFYGALPLVLLWPAFLLGALIAAAVYYVVVVPLRWVFNAVAGR